MAKIKLIQLLCSSRHLLAALAFDPETTTAAETKRVLSQSLTRNHVNACGTCKTTELHFESVETNFDTIAEAARMIIDNNDGAFVELYKKNEFKVHDPVLTKAANKCVRCRKTLSAATGLQSKEPSTGDISICTYCGQIMLFRADRTLRAPDARELQNLKDELRANQPEVLRLVEQSVLRFVAGRASREN